jgi:hypothetical protein
MPPFITLNGLTVPLAADAQSRAYDDSGRASRGASGQLSKDRRFCKRKWDFKTTVLSQMDYLALRGCLHERATLFPLGATGMTHNLPDVLVASQATGTVFTQSTAADALIWPGAAKFGTSALQVPSQATNILSANIVTGTETSSNTLGFTALAAATLSSDTAHVFAGTRALKMASAATGGGWRTTAYATPAIGWRYAASFFVLGDPQPLTASIMAGTTLLGSKVFTPGTAAWRRVQVLADVTVPAATTDLHLKVTQNSAASINCWFDNIQLETNGGAGNPSWVSPWVNGTRGAAGYISYQAPPGSGLLGSKAGVSINAWVGALTRPGAVIARCLQYGTPTPSPEAALRCGSFFQNAVLPTGLLPAVVASNGTTVSGATATSATWTDDTWTMLTAVVLPDPPSGETSTALYINGKIAARGNPDLHALNPALFDLLYIGQDNGAFHLNAPLNDLAIFPYPLGSAAVSSLYARTAALVGTWPILTAEGDAWSEGAVQVAGRMEKADYVPHPTSSSATALGVVASFSLMEI